MLIGEERNTETRTVSFFCVGRSGPVWKGKNFGERWWTGIEAVHRGVLFLYGFATPDLPGRRGITAVDCDSGELLWKNGDLTFIGAAGESVYASQETYGGPIVSEVHYRTGALLGEPVRGNDAVDRIPRTGEVPDDVHYPQVLSEDDASPLSATVRKFSAPVLPERPVEFGEHGAFLVIVRDRARETGPDGRTSYVRELDVLERATGNPALHVTLDPAVSGPAYGTFLVCTDMLYFVREGRTVTAVELRLK